ncbi:MAG: ATP-binding protein [Chromatiales bacterium]
MQRRLSWGLWGTALLVFILVAVGLAVFHRFTLEHRALRIMEPYVRMIAVGTDAAVSFEDPVRAQEILDTLDGSPDILGAEIVLDNGQLLASFGAVSKELHRTREVMRDGVYVGDDRIDLLQSLPMGGWLKLGISQERLNRETYQVLGLFGAGLLVLIMATFGQLIVLRRTIVKPITSLSKATELIRDRADYTHRVPAAGSDEIARLGRDFNTMVEVIQEREENLRQVSALQRAILDNAAHVIISATPDGLVTTYNPAAERMLGYTADEVIDKQTPALWHDAEEVKQHAHQLSEELGEEIEPGFEVFTARPKRNLPEENEWTFICKNGKHVPVLLTVTALQDGTGQIMGFVGLAYDLTERKRAREQLQRHKDELEHTVQQRTQELMLARDAAEAANRAKSVFLANMSHELRTPLNAILGFSSLIGRDYELSASQREKIEIINRSGEHLLTLINDVLDIAKIEAGKVQLDISSFDFGAMVRDVADMMRLRAQGKGLQLDLEMASECPRYLEGDEARLRQILINLVGNAVKFTEKGGVIIRFCTHSHEGLHLLIEVEDTGPGISEMDRKRLFKPFVQLAEKGEQKGTGLGLSITKQFVELMKGNISVESTKGKGSLFRVELPITPADRLDVATAEMESIGEIVGLEPGQPKYRIIIAEDQRENQLLLQKLMVDIDLEVKLADNGEQCVRIFQQWPADLIWMDMRMPVMDGTEATRRIRSLPGGDKVRVVAVTASAFKEEQQEILASGLDDFVKKPFRFDDIYHCLARQLDLKYQYKTEGAEKAEPVVLTSAMLDKVSDELRKELGDALVSLDSDRIASVVNKISNVDASLGYTLRRLSEYFDYQTILDALNYSPVERT